MLPAEVKGVVLVKKKRAGLVLCKGCSNNYTDHHTDKCGDCRVIYCGCGAKLRPYGATRLHKKQCRACQRKAAKENRKYE